MSTKILSLKKGGDSQITVKKITSWQVGGGEKKGSIWRRKGTPGGSF
jgi:hypothetical protein